MMWPPPPFPPTPNPFSFSVSPTLLLDIYTEQWCDTPSPTPHPLPPPPPPTSFSFSFVVAYLQWTANGSSQHDVYKETNYWHKCGAQCTRLNQKRKLQWAKSVARAQALSEFTGGNTVCGIVPKKHIAECSWCFRMSLKLVGVNTAVKDALGMKIDCTF